MAEVIRLSDIADLGEAGANEELLICDLGDAEAVSEFCTGLPPGVSSRATA
jgi:uronate dehydrogenase